LKEESISFAVIGGGQIKKEKGTCCSVSSKQRKRQAHFIEGEEREGLMSTKDLKRKPLKEGAGGARVMSLI